jgi:hypothetical protein
VTIIPLSNCVNQRARVLWLAYHMRCVQRSEKSQALTSITTILKMINNLSNKTRTQIEIQASTKGTRNVSKPCLLIWEVWMKFIHVIDNIVIRFIHVIDNIDINLWWMKLCVYGFVDTNAIQAIYAKWITWINYNMK